MKKILEGIKSRLDEAEAWISELEDNLDKNIQAEQQKTKQNKKWLKKNEESLREL